MKFGGTSICYECNQYLILNEFDIFNVLTMLRARIPVADSITEMEVWMLACMILVFLTVILRKEVQGGDKAKGP